MTQTPPADVSYEAAIAELEGIVNQMENGQLPLEASIAAYQRGATLVKQCQTALAQAEQQVCILTDAGALTPYDDNTAE